MTRRDITPSQTIGPFFAGALTLPEVHPGGFPGSNLIDPSVSGQPIIIEGRVYDGDGQPVFDAMIEIWQADAEGRYAHPADSRSRANATFVGFGRVGTDTAGRYTFTTIKPGPVPSVDGTVQAPHISINVFARGLLNRLHTRLYFPDEANTADPVLALVPETVRATLIAALMDGSEGKRYRFDIHLQGERETVFFAC